MYYNRSVHDRNEVRRLRVCFVLGAFIASMLCITPAHAHDSDLGPFGPLSSIPNEVDAAAVFENPAESLLLSPVGRSMRSLLAMGGVFTQTERAWQALGDAFKAPVDDTIRALLSKRVTVVWDGFDLSDPNMQGFTESIDTQWTLVCEVEHEYLKEIRESLSLVKRNIVDGRAVYAIEQGRYRVALLENPKHGAPAIVLLAPRKGADLLNAVLSSIIKGEQPAADHSAITSGHEPMLRELSTQHEAKGNGEYSFSFITRMPIFRVVLGLPPLSNPSEEHIFAGIVKLDEGTVRCSFASDIPIESDLPDAPIALLESISPDSIVAIASARSPRLIMDEDSLHMSFGISSKNQDSDQHNLFNAPALIVMQPEGPEKAIGMCVLLRQPKRDPGETAKLSDETVQSMIRAFDATQAPNFNGRFPAVVRSITLQSSESNESEEQPTWPGPKPRIAWVSTNSTNNDLFIASMSPENADPANAISTLQDAALIIDALGEQPPSGVLLRAMLKPAQTLRVLGDASFMDLALAKLVRQIDLEIRRGIESSFRGELNLQLADPRAGANLGIE